MYDENSTKLFLQEVRNDMSEPMNDAAQLQELSEQRRVRREKLAELQAAGNDPFQITSYKVTHTAKEVRDHYEELEGKSVSLAGRMMSRRRMGKASFIDLRDHTDRMQSYVRIDDVGEDSYNAFKKWDIGDIIGLKGTVFKTKSGEISIHATEIVLLSKALLPLPEKFHGLTDTEMRYRQRYVDLIMNPEVRDTFYKRSQILKEVRAYLDGIGYLEVDTPVLHTLEIGAAARPFVTHHNALDIDMYLRIETELYLFTGFRILVGK